MENFYLINLKKIVALFFFTAGVAITALAQTPPYFKGTGTGVNTIPMNTAGSHCQQLYLPTDFNTVPISGNITKIYFRNSVAGASGTYTNFEVNFLQNSLTAFPNNTFLTGFTPALSSPSITISGNAVSGEWYEIPLTTPFLYNNTLTLICEIKYTARTGGMSGYTTTAIGNKRLSIITAPGPATGNLSTLWGDFGIEVVGCTSPPTPGTATVSASTVCAGTSVTLDLTGNSTGPGQTYQWQAAPAAGGPYTNVGGSQTTSSLSITASTTQWYRAAVTCGGNTQFSVPVLLTVNPALGGTYTINSAVATGGSNFQTFADAVTALTGCPIIAPVIFNVNATSGPYNEQVVIPAIAGASATNTITFNGNGRIISDNGLAPIGQKAVFKLDGADYITINNFIINTGAGAYGYGVHILNDADNNTVSNCVINTNTSSTSNLNYAGVVINGSSSTLTASSVSLCDNNTISNNTITGGFVGVAIVANSITSQVFGNKVMNNTIREFYNFGIYLNGNVSSLVEGNDFSRPTRTVFNTFYGVYFNNISLNVRVNKNKFHDPFKGFLSVSNGAFAVANVNCDATAGNENVISNNLVYDFLGSTGNQNGFINANSDFITYYHNTVVLEDMAASCSACGTRGFYIQGTGTGLTYKNNIVTIKRGGTGDKQGIFFEQTTLTGITLSNNDYYFYPGVSGLQEIGHIGLTGGTGYTTIAAWQAGTGQEAGSVSIDPVYLNPGIADYHPTAATLNDLGTPVGILTDLIGASRSLTTPDMGAYEFNIGGGLDLSATALINPIVKTCYSAAENITVSITNNSTSAINFALNPATLTLMVTGATTATLTQLVNTGTLAAGATMNVNFVATLNMSATGTYTFNASIFVAGDLNPANDAMTPVTRTAVAVLAGTVSSSATSYCVTGGIPTLTLSGNAGGSIQWQETVISATGPWTNVGTNSTTYTPATAITATTYYRSVVSCNATAANSNVVTVTLNNPLILTTTPGSRCGTGTVTLGATSNAGSTINWYQNLTGGAVLGTGTSFVTPSISVTTSFYASATTGGGCESTPRTTVLASVTPAPAAIIAYSGTPYCTGGGVIPVIFSGTGGGSYSASPAGLSLNAATGAITLASSAVGTYTITYTVAAVGACPVYTTTTTITVNPAPSATIAYTGSPYCNAGLATVTRTGSVGGNFSSTAGLIINAGTGDVNLATSSPGTYIVTYNIASTGGCPSFTTTTTIIINPNSTAPTSATASVSTLCGSGTVSLTLTGGSLAPGASWVWYRGGCGGISIGTGATLNNIPVTSTSTFYVRAEGICFTTSCASVTVTVFTRPVVELTPSPNTSTINPSIRTLLKTTVSPPGVYTYSWFKNAFSIPFTGTDLIVDVDGFGSYYVVVRDANGCSAQSTSVTVAPRGSNSLFIYPNPNNGQFQVRFFEVNPSTTATRNLTIYDSKGARVLQNTYSAISPYMGMAIDLRRYGKGVYHIMLSDATGNKIAAGKVIVY